MSETIVVPQPKDVATAVGRVQSVANLTPIMASRTLDAQVGGQVYCKCENFQRVGAFKFRGAYNAISQLTSAQKAAGVITHSSGNHAQGVALAARLLDVQATIVMPHSAPAVKREATAGYGAHIISVEAVDRERVTDELVAEHGYTLIHPYDNEHVIAGQGTAVWELFDQVGELDMVVVPVGGGGLLSGSALAGAYRYPACRVVGVEPEIADDATRSWQTGQVVRLDHVPQTIADGTRTRFVGERNLAVMRKYVADMVTVSEAEILTAVQFAWARLKVVIEPSAALPLAALLHGRVPLPTNNAGLRIGIVFSGGNVNVPGCGFFHTAPAT